MLKFLTSLAKKCAFHLNIFEISNFALSTLTHSQNSTVLKMAVCHMSAPLGMLENGERSLEMLLTRRRHGRAMLWSKTRSTDNDVPQVSLKNVVYRQLSSPSFVPCLSGSLQSTCNDHWALLQISLQCLRHNFSSRDHASYALAVCKETSRAASALRTRLAKLFCPEFIAKYYDVSLKNM